MDTYRTKGVVFVDAEIGVSDHKVHDIGALREDGCKFHSASKNSFAEFVLSAKFVCGHNISHHDALYLSDSMPTGVPIIDTLYLSPLLFPKQPYHKLLKDDKILSEELNNPVNDCQKCRDLLYDEISAFLHLPDELQSIYYSLLSDKVEFSGFFKLIGKSYPSHDTAALIRQVFKGSICEHADIEMLVRHYPVESAYVLALIRTEDRLSITPPWVLYHYPKVDGVETHLRHTPCVEGCEYCKSKLDIHQGLKRYFGFDEFRLFDGEPMQERAVQAAINRESLLAIFPTGGGKSLTFQLPAMMEGDTVHGLTVVISPLQSLMKDQVDNLAERGITSAVTINGLLDPVTRAEAVSRVADGRATMLYISPEILRSRTIEHLLSKRHVVRFVIDEAHCFSAWGQDFRVDYLYIGPFIAKLQAAKNYKNPIPISCFTATAKQKVISDICDYFRNTLATELRLFASSSARTNLQYSVIHVDDEEEKYSRLRSLINGCDGPSIIYVARTRKTTELAEKLTHDGLKALPFNGKMDANQKVSNQNAFMNGEVRTIVATSAFGMGVDKKDVELVVHYDISDSLENYVQEAGRAGRDPSMRASCFVLYSDQDLDKHFVLLNQTKLSIGEIQQVWSAIKTLTKQNSRTCCSALEIARQAGWDDSVQDIETRVRTAVSALEQAGYVQRGNNVPHVYATGIQVKNMDEAHQRIINSAFFSEDERETAVRVIKSLITSKNTASTEDDAESRVDYLADHLGLTKEQVIDAVEHMRQEGILADSKDITAYMSDDDTTKKSLTQLERYTKLERFILSAVPQEGLETSYKQLNDMAVSEGIGTSSIRQIRNLLFFLTIKGYFSKNESVGQGDVSLMPMHQSIHLSMMFQRRIAISRFLLERLYDIAAARSKEQHKSVIAFSLVEMLRRYQVEQQMGLFANDEQVTLADIEEALLYLSKIGALKLEGGFLVLYNTMEIKRLKDVRLRYKQEDYRLLNEFYKQKIQQVHIVGEYANLMVRDYDAALQYVQDYFQMDHKKFIAKYFKGERAAELEMNITPAKYQQLFGQLSARQRQIINDKESRYIVVAAGPGSGKTKVLVHKMASLLLLEEVKHEQLLMLTFSRAAATEFKSRLIELIGNAAHFVEIKTFHSYCFDLLGRIGNLDDAKDVVQRAADLINQGEVEPNRISKAVLVIDEAQDMDQHEFALVQALMKANEDMRIIAVGDDDQNIFQFRGSDSQYMKMLVINHGARLYEMTDNYRSCSQVVSLANGFVASIRNRMKTTPISAIQADEGTVQVTLHSFERMEIPLAEEVKETYYGGSSCVLTRTNDEALLVTALLRKHHIPCRLIQSLDGFRFSDLAEIRYFLRVIEREITSPTIPDHLWERAVGAVTTHYANSACLNEVLRSLAAFEHTNRTKYLTDLREFFGESSIEDFCQQGGKEVLVSTIHKAKGREFDTVYMLNPAGSVYSDDYKRLLYVGLTRAKRRLYIHTCDNLFTFPGMTNIKADNNKYPEPSDITVQMTHRDVFLDYFKDKKGLILSMRSGDPLDFANDVLSQVGGRPLARLSAKQSAELKRWQQLGYNVISAQVRFVVAWHPKDAAPDEPEYAVLLANLNLRKQTSPISE